MKTQNCYEIALPMLSFLGLELLSEAIAGIQKRSQQIVRLRNSYPKNSVLDIISFRTCFNSLPRDSPKLWPKHAAKAWAMVARPSKGRTAETSPGYRRDHFGRAFPEGRHFGRAMWRVIPKINYLGEQCGEQLKQGPIWE